MSYYSCLLRVDIFQIALNRLSVRVLDRRKFTAVGNKVMTLEVGFANHDIRVGRLAQQAVGIQQLSTGLNPSTAHLPIDIGRSAGKDRIKTISHITAFITQRKAAIERQLYVRAVTHAIMTRVLPKRCGSTRCSFGFAIPATSIRPPIPRRVLRKKRVKCTIPL